MMRLKDRVAVVTGAGHGIGRASALRMGAEGARLAVLDVNGEAARETCRLAEESGIDAAAWTVDVTDPGQVEACIAEVAERYGRIDILHSNAGVLIPGTVLSLDLEEWERTLA